MKIFEWLWKNFAQLIAAFIGIPLAILLIMIIGGRALYIGPYLIQLVKPLGAWTLVPGEDQAPFDVMRCQYKFRIASAQYLVTPVRVGPGDLHAVMQGPGDPAVRAVGVAKTDKGHIAKEGGYFDGEPIELYESCLR